MKTKILFLFLILSFSVFVACPPPIHIFYDGNYADSGTVPVDKNYYSVGEEAVVLGNTGNLTKAGHTFGGWNTQSDGNGTNYSAGDSFLITGEDTAIYLYAKWVPNE